MRPAQIIPETPIGPPRAVAAHDISRGLEESILLNKTRVRRRWLVRTGAALLVTGVALTLLVMWQRDQMNKAGDLRLAEPACAALQAKIDVLKSLPIQSPRFPGRYRVTESISFYAANSGGPVIVATLGQTKMILAGDGLCVLIYEGGKVRPEWLTLTEFRARWLKQEQRVKDFEAQRRNRPPELP